MGCVQTILNSCVASGVQGDPLSPYLFLLAVETLAIAIRATEEITGMVINQEETAKLLQPNFLYESAHNYKLFQLLDNFKEFSGLKVNSAKTEGLWIGSLNDSESKPLGIKWPTEPIKKLINIWSFLSKSLLIPKIVYTSSLLPTPEHIGLRI